MQERVASQILFGMGGGGQRGDDGAEWEGKRKNAKLSRHFIVCKIALNSMSVAGA